MNRRAPFTLQACDILDPLERVDQELTSLTERLVCADADEEQLASVARALGALQTAKRNARALAQAEAESTAAVS